MLGKQQLPATLERSPKKVQRTWLKAHDSAVGEYGESQRAHDRTAFPALKRSFEKVGHHCEEKDEFVDALHEANDRETRRGCS